MKKKINDPTPSLHQARLKIQHHAPDYSVYVIYRGESFSDLRGPGYFNINPITERVGELVSTKPRAYPLLIENLVTRDPISIALAGKVSFTFDPRNGDVVTISRLVKIPEPDLTNALGDALKELIFKAIRARANEFWFQEIQRGENLARLETWAAEALLESTALTAFGISNVGVLFTHAVLPQEIETRLKEAAQRRYNAQATGEMPQADLLRSLIVELVEKVNREGNLEQLFNFTEAVNTLRQIEATAPPATKTIDGETVAPPAEPTPSSPPPTPAPSKPKTKSSKKRMSPSFLDPDL